MKTIYMLSVCLFILSNVLFAQSTNQRIGINIVPLFDRTIELNATLLGNSGYEVFVQSGYSWPKSYPKNQAENYSRYWEGKASGAYLRVGTRVYLNKTGRVRFFLGPYLTAGYLDQAGKSIVIVNCIMAPCPPKESEGKSREYSLSAGITGGIQTNLSPRLTVDLGVQANTFVFGKPDLYANNIYVPGYGRQPFQGITSIQYTLKRR